MVIATRGVACVCCCAFACPRGRPSTLIPIATSLLLLPLGRWRLPSAISALILVENLLKLLSRPVGTGRCFGPTKSIPLRRVVLESTRLRETVHSDAHACITCSAVDDIHVAATAASLARFRMSMETKS